MPALAQHHQLVLIRNGEKLLKKRGDAPLWEAPPTWLLTPGLLTPWPVADRLLVSLPSHRGFADTYRRALHPS